MNLTLNILKCSAAVFAFGSLAVSGASAQTLLLQYTFDEADGPALDYGSGTASPGTLMGGAVRSSNTPGGFGSSVSFLNDAPYAHVLGEDAAKLDGLSQFTLTTWLNVSAYPSGNHRLVAKQAGGAFGGFNWGMNAVPNDGAVGPDNFRLGLFVGNNVSSGAADFAAVYSSVDVDAHNKWVFLATTYDGITGTVNFYIGDPVSGVSQLGAAQSTIAITVDGGTARFGVGFTDAAPTSNTSVIGLQDDIRVYAGVLDATALEAIRLEAIPEPSTYAAIFGGLALLAVGVRRYRRNRA